MCGYEDRAYRFGTAVIIFWGSHKGAYCYDVNLWNVVSMQYFLLQTMNTLRNLLVYTIKGVVRSHGNFPIATTVASATRWGTQPFFLTFIVKRTNQLCNTILLCSRNQKFTKYMYAVGWMIDNPVFSLFIAHHCKCRLVVSFLQLKKGYMTKMPCKVVEVFAM